MVIVVTCRHCGKREYHGEMRWLSGKEMCRDCYKAAYESTYGELYRWDDLEGERPDDNE